MTTAPIETTLSLPIADTTRATCTGRVEKAPKARGSLAFACGGINDAPALAKSNVGVARGTGTEIAIEVADVELVPGRPPASADAVGLPRATMRNIKENLFRAFACNAALIPVAAGVLYPAVGSLLSPVLAAGALAMPFAFVPSYALCPKRYGART